MTRFADTKTISKQQEALGELHPDIIGFKEEIAKKFPNVKYTSELRKGAKTKQGRVSKHALGEALDVRPDPNLLNYLLNDREGVSLMNKYNLGILDETSAEMLAKTGGTGAHYHIGKDMQLVAQTKARFNKLGEMEVPKRTKLELNDNLPIQYAEQIQITEKPKEEEGAVDVAKQSLEVKMGLKEELLTALQKAQIQPLERVVDNTPQQIEPFRSPYEGLMQDGGELFMQMGGKAPIFVDSKNDPRYKAYQDSLETYKGGIDANKKMKPFIGMYSRPSVIDDNKESKNLWMSSLGKKEGKTSHKLKDANITIEQPYKKGIAPISSNLYNSKSTSLTIQNYKKPQQEIIVQQKDTPQVSNIINNLTPIGIQTQEMEFNNSIPQPNVQTPKYWGIKDINNQNFGGYEQSYKIYPDTIDNLRDLPKEGWNRQITPKYQDGGNIIEDDMGYWNPSNWGKDVKINSPFITMRGVFEPLIGISEQTGEAKIMLPNQEYFFDSTQSVVEKPLTKKKLKLKKK